VTGALDARRAPLGVTSGACRVHLPDDVHADRHRGPSGHPHQRRESRQCLLADRQIGHPRNVERLAGTIMADQTITLNSGTT